MTDSTSLRVVATHHHMNICIINFGLSVSFTVGFLLSLQLLGSIQSKAVEILDPITAISTMYS